jgi:hypothetical protein
MPMPFQGWYILNDSHEPVPEPDVLKAAEWFENFPNRVVAQHEIGESHVSTVFLGLDHNHGNGPPVLFETLIQGGPLDDHMERYATWGEAVAGHTALLRALAEPMGKPFTEVAVSSAPTLTPRELGRTIYERLLEDA